MGLGGMYQHHHHRLQERGKGSELILSFYNEETMNGMFGSALPMRCLPTTAVGLGVIADNPISMQMKDCRS